MTINTADCQSRVLPCIIVCDETLFSYDTSIVLDGLDAY